MPLSPVQPGKLTAPNLLTRCLVTDRAVRVIGVPNPELYRRLQSTDRGSHGSGIGLETSILFAKEGANVLMADISGPALENALAKVRQLVPAAKRIETMVSFRGLPSYYPITIVALSPLFYGWKPRTNYHAPSRHRSATSLRKLKFKRSSSHLTAQGAWMSCSTTRGSCTRVTTTL